MGARKTLRSGFSTGACAAAAAKGATLALLGRGPEKVSLRLPWGAVAPGPVEFAILTREVGEDRAICSVRKDAGDDPDVTDGIEIFATVSRTPRAGDTPVGVAIEIDGGEGVGRVTKPGLAATVGAAAINPVPLAMIEATVREALQEAGGAGGDDLRVVIGVPRGEEVARKTLNARLGILGGISILGTTGIVIPMSDDAWRATIDACLDVALAAGAPAAVLAHGRSSESAARQLFPELPPEAFVLMGDHVGYGLAAAASRNLPIRLVGQFAKFCKVAAGNFETHVKDSSLDLALLSQLLSDAGFSPEEASSALAANTAREVYERLRAGGDRGVFPALCRAVAARGIERSGGGVSVEAILFGYGKELLARFSLPATKRP